jgi:hypothetical protein
VCAGFAIGYSQTDVRPGIRIGLNIASVGGSDVPSDRGSTAQYLIGGFLDIKFPGGIALQPELLYSVKGFSYSNETIDGVVYTDDSQQLQYLDIPILLKYTFPSANPGAKWSIFAGPSFGFLVGAKETYTEDGVDYSEDNKSDYHSTDVGFIIGAGVTIPLRVVSVVVDVRYNAGLSEVPTGGYDVYNRVFSITGGIEF